MKLPPPPQNGKACSQSEKSEKKENFNSAPLSQRQQFCLNNNDFVLDSLRFASTLERVKGNFLFASLFFWVLNCLGEKNRQNNAS